MSMRIWILVGILIIGGAAFVYLDPLDLDLLGLKQGSPAAKPAAPQHAAAPAPKPDGNAPAPKPGVAAPAVPASVAPAKSSAPTPAKSTAAAPAKPVPVAAPKAAVVPAQQAKAPATPHPVAPMTKTPATATGQALEPPLKLSETMKTEKVKSDNPPRPKNLDLRHCLELETDAAIAKCAGE